MEMKAIIIVAFVAALAISAQARRGSNGRQGKESGRERGQGRFGGRPDGMQMGGPRQDGGGRHGDGEEGTDAAHQIGDGLGGSQRLDGHGRGRGPHGHHQGPPQNHTEEHPFGQRNDSSEEDGRSHPNHHRHHGHHHHRHHNHTEGQQGHNETGELPHRHHNKSGDENQDRPMINIRPFRFNHLGKKPLGDRPFNRRNGTVEGSHRRNGNRGRWGENESREEEHPTTENGTTPSPP